ncbi:MAG: cytochrome c biogenesis protein ResB [Actinomycetota bacterium]|nr:cytochrome c biogenesis protein ResB [Actinomycetota bacterium]
MDAPAGPGASRNEAAVELSPRALARWAWRQLTSMRTALILLFLLALAAVPGSVIPQADVAPAEVLTLRETSPQLAQWYDRLGLFDVYGSVWFSAVYVLLMVSLVGCVVPRSLLHWRAWRAEPPRAPRHLSRLGTHTRWTTTASRADVAARAAEVLRQRRFRVRRYTDEEGRAVVAAERGRLREAGNLAFHLSLIVVLAGVAVGSLYGFSGNVLVVERQGFSNTLTQYDEFWPGARFDPDELAPFSFTVDDFAVRFELRGEQRGAPRAFAADLTYTTEPGAPRRRHTLRVNHPLQIRGTSVFLVGHGYAPRVTVRDGRGDVAFSGPVPFLPEDATYTSFGVVKVPDAAPVQLGFEGYFLPTAVIDEHGPRSVFPDALDPSLVLTAYRGDLGMDDGRPQSVFVLDKDRLRQFRTDSGEPFRTELRRGETVRLPGGAGAITFDGLDRAVQLQVSSSPGKVVALVGVLVAIAALVASLYVRPRRAWVRVDDRAGLTVVEVAGLDRVAGGDLEADLASWVTQIRAHAHEKEPV